VVQNDGLKADQSRKDLENELGKRRGGKGASRDRKLKKGRCRIEEKRHSDLLWRYLFWEENRKVKRLPGGWLEDIRVRRPRGGKENRRKVCMFRLYGSGQKIADMNRRFGISFSKRILEGLVHLRDGGGRSRMGVCVWHTRRKRVVLKNTNPEKKKTSIEGKYENERGEGAVKVQTRDPRRGGEGFKGGGRAVLLKTSCVISLVRWAGNWKGVEEGTGTGPIAKRILC